MILTARSKIGLQVFHLEKDGTLSSPTSLLGTELVVRQSKWSSNGLCLAVSLATEIVIFTVDKVNNRELKESWRVSVSCADFVFSPSGQFLATFEKPRIHFCKGVSLILTAPGHGLENEANKQHFNVKGWRLQAGEAICIGEFSHKIQSTWKPQWTSDETHFARLSPSGSELCFYRAAALDKAVFRLQTDNIGSFAISPGSYPKVAVFIKEAKVRRILSNNLSLTRV